MPKFSLKRRHRRQHDLSIFQECSGDGLARTAAARMVSDDDIQLTSDDAKTFSFVEIECQNERRLKRPAPSICLSDLAAPASPGVKSFVESKFLCVSPTRNEPNRLPTPTNSPWGHFVDMLIPLSPSEEDLSSERKEQHRFLPFCPSPDRTSLLSDKRSKWHHPYCRPGRRKDQRSQKRLPIASSSKKDRSSNKDTKLTGFILRVPDQKTSALMLEETQDAFQDLHV